jgi:hypothetical protein
LNTALAIAAAVPVMPISPTQQRETARSGSLPLARYQKKRVAI